jgi:hypothetical protein
MEKILNFEDYDWLSHDPVQNTYFITKNDICYKNNDDNKVFSGLENIDKSNLANSHLSKPEAIKFSHIYSGKNAIIHGGGKYLH